MVFIWRFIIIVAVLYYVSRVSTTYINQIIDGSLTGQWDITMTLMVDDLEGVVLYVIDSSGDQFGIIVTRHSDYYKYVRINYNTVYKDIRLRQLCGCDPCIMTIMRFLIRFVNEIITINCNFFTTTNNVTKSGDNNNNNNILYPIPLTITDKKDKLFIMIGNIGPYIDNNGVMIEHLAAQMDACLLDFYYNNRLLFTEVIRHRCSHECMNNICNGGICKRYTSSLIYCDCSSTALNGLYCNRSMKTFVRGTHNSFETDWLSKEVDLKISWKQLFINEKYCLMDVVGRHNINTVWINKSQLMMNNIIIGGNDIFGNNFVRIIIKKNNIYLSQTKYKYESKIEILLEESVRINIGVSETKTRCETFEGSYDIYDPQLNLRHTRGLKTSNTYSVVTNTAYPSQIPSLQTTTSFSTAKMTKTVYHSQMSVILLTLCIFASVIIICVVLISTLCVLRNRIFKKNPDRINDKPEFIDLRGGNNADIPIYNPYSSIYETYALNSESNNIDNSRGRKFTDETMPKQPSRNEEMDYCDMIDPRVTHDSYVRPTDTDHNGYIAMDLGTMCSIHRGNIVNDYSTGETVQDLPHMEQ